METLFKIRRPHGVLDPGPPVPQFLQFCFLCILVSKILRAAPATKNYNILPWIDVPRGPLELPFGSLGSTAGPLKINRNH